MQIIISEENVRSNGRKGCDMYQCPNCHNTSGEEQRTYQDYEGIVVVEVTCLDCGHEWEIDIEEDGGEVE
jgi:RNase P subunit RPR2